MPTHLKRMERAHKARLRLNAWKQRKLAENRLHEFWKEKDKAERDKDAGKHNHAAVAIRGPDARLCLLPDVEGGAVRLEGEK